MNAENMRQIRFLIAVTIFITLLCLNVISYIFNNLLVVRIGPMYVKRKLFVLCEKSKGQINMFKHRHKGPIY